MNKPHKHAELIKAWADGAQIQERVHSTIDDTCIWIDQALPRWIPEHEYRIKPPEFEDYAYYPALDMTGECIVVEHVRGDFYATASEYPNKLHQLQWIGEKLEIQWPEDLSN